GPMATSVEEADVGITEFVSQHGSFSGILKHRFRDFQVREVDPQGHVARLTTLEPPVKDGSSGPNVPRQPFQPARLPAERAQLVAAFAALAGQENGAVLDELLGRVIEMYGNSSTGTAAVAEAAVAVPEAPAAGATAATAVAETGAAANAAVGEPA
ncbi:hypothetical protein Agub_g13589, partial [Astrephomene gubernaculifera]